MPDSSFPILSEALPVRRRLVILPMALLGLGGHFGVRAAPDAQALLSASDAIRNPTQPFRVTVTLTEFAKGVQVDATTLVSYARTLESGGQFATITRFVRPPRDAGKVMLKNGSDLWFYDPGTKAAVRISPQQRLLGQAANGDVVTVNFAQTYQASLAQEEEVQDGERQNRRAVKLQLEAKAPDVTYHAIEMWLDRDNYRPIKARFLSESGRLLKTAFYRRFKEELGAVRPTEVVIIDGLDPALVTVMRYGEFQARDIPDSWFQRDYMARFQAE